MDIDDSDEISEELPNDILVPQLDDDFVVDSSSTNLLDEEIPVKESSQEDDIMAALDEEEEIDNAPTEEVFNSQWDAYQPSNSEISITAEELDIARKKAETEIVEEPTPVSKSESLPEDLKKDVKSVLEYMDQLLENLPDDKIKEFAKSEHFDVYKKLFTELGLA